MRSVRILSGEIGQQMVLGVVPMAKRWVLVYVPKICNHLVRRGLQPDNAVLHSKTSAIILPDVVCSRTVLYCIQKDLQSFCQAWSVHSEQFKSREQATCMPRAVRESRESKLCAQRAV